MHARARSDPPDSWLARRIIAADLYRTQNDTHVLTTPRLRLRLLGPDDTAAVTTYLVRNREHFSRAGPRVDDAYFTHEYQQTRLTRELEMMDEGTLVRLWVFLRDGAANAGPIGDISLSHIIHGVMFSCFLGYKIDSEHAGKGYMTEALGRAVEFAFENLGLHRVEANIMPSNIRSQRVVERLGFSREGYSRSYLLINGVWEDHLRYTRLNDAWTASSPSRSIREALAYNDG